jgi:transcriptional regulator with GAF, ATPase, and Fis domain
MEEASQPRTVQDLKEEIRILKEALREVTSDMIQPWHVKKAFRMGQAARAPRSPNSAEAARDLRKIMAFRDAEKISILSREETETRESVLNAMIKTEGNQKKAAEILGTRESQVRGLCTRWAIPQNGGTK